MGCPCTNQAWRRVSADTFDHLHSRQAACAKTLCACGERVHLLHRAHLQPVDTKQIVTRLHTVKPQGKGCHGLLECQDLATALDPLGLPNGPGARVFPPSVHQLMGLDDHGHGCLDPLRRLVKGPLPGPAAVQASPLLGEEVDVPIADGRQPLRSLQLRGGALRAVRLHVQDHIASLEAAKVAPAVPDAAPHIGVGPPRLHTPLSPLCHGAGDGRVVGVRLHRRQGVLQPDEEGSELGALHRSLDR